MNPIVSKQVYSHLLTDDSIEDGFEKVKTLKNHIIEFEEELFYYLSNKIIDNGFSDYDIDILDLDHLGDQKARVEFEYIIDKSEFDTCYQGYIEDGITIIIAAIYSYDISFDKYLDNIENYELVDYELDSIKIENSEGGNPFLHLDLTSDKYADVLYKILDAITEEEKDEIMSRLLNGIEYL